MCICGNVDWVDVVVDVGVLYCDNVVSGKEFCEVDGVIVVFDVVWCDKVNVVIVVYWIGIWCVKGLVVDFVLFNDV